MKTIEFDETDDLTRILRRFDKECMDPTQRAMGEAFIRESHAALLECSKLGNYARLEKTFDCKGPGIQVVALSRRQRGYLSLILAKLGRR